MSRPVPVFKKRPKGFFGSPHWKKALNSAELDSTEGSSSTPVGDSTPVEGSSSTPVGDSTPVEGSSSTPVGDSTPVEGSAERPLPVPTASGKKLALSGNLPCSSSLDTESYEYVGKLCGIRLIDCEEYMEHLSETGECPKCHSPLTLSENLVTKRGLVSDLKTICSTCDYAIKMSDPYSHRTKSLNTKSVLAMRSIGRGHSSMLTFCSMMDMLPPLSKPRYSEHNHSIATASEKAALDDMLSASAYLHVLHGSAPTEVIDVSVTCDGTWSKRGFTATYGVVVVISWESGKILDYEILSKRCNTCERQKTRWGEESDQFKEWMETHKDSCAINHEGSSPAMECQGVLRIWNRSVESRHLRYTQLISDGDCKSLATLNEHKPYGEDVKVEKHECVGHVQKRVTPKVKQARTMFNRDKAAAKKKVKELKGRMKEVREQYGLERGRTGKKQVEGQGKVTGRGRGKGRGRGRGKENERMVDEEKQVEGRGKVTGRGRGKGKGRGRGKGKGRMVDEEGEGEKKLKIMQEELDKIKVPQGQVNDDTIRRLQMYYGNAIRASVGHLEKMGDACWAVMYHSLSTDENPRHYCCPRGSNSWCTYQRMLACGGDLPVHHVQTSSCSSKCNACHTTIPADFEEYLEPQWRSLTTPELLGRCLLGATQNSNESFNGMVWSRCPKTEYCNLDTVMGAVAQSVLVFNSGHQALVKLMDQLGIPVGPLCTSYFASRDLDRVKRAECKSEVVAKRRRQTIQRRNACVEQQCIEKEGTTYGSGLF